MKKILIVEDDEVLREVLVYMFRSEGFETVEAENGLIGYEVFLAEHPDVIVSDVIMPKCDGVEFSRRVFSSAHPVPIAIVSGYTNNLNLNDLSQSPHLIGVFEKPFDENHLIKEVKAAVKL
tara:strand:- start:30012 stop:30374 length:363 start_codon:yes stop_codon:yes gene_type:complete